MATPTPLVLIVRQFDGQAMSGIRARFGSEGGSIGRADENRLVLVDPDKTISRVHARLRCDGNRWWLRQVGSNPMRLNDQPLAHEQEVLLGHGDWIQIGPYRIETLLEPEATPAAARQGAAPPATPAAPAAPAWGSEPDDLDLTLYDGGLSTQARVSAQAAQQAAADPALPAALDPQVLHALQALLDRFEPEALAEQFGAQGWVDNLLPLTRRARLWEQYEAQFNALRLQALHAFQSHLAARGSGDDGDDRDGASGGDSGANSGGYGQDIGPVDGRP